MTDPFGLLVGRSATTLEAPGPTPEQIEQLLQAATTVPDHGKLFPFRFAVVEPDGRHAFGQALAAVAREHSPSASDSSLEKMSAKAFRSPASIVLIASPKPGKIETWEQHATAACAGFAIVLAARALGIGAVWKSVPFTRGTALAELFAMSETEQMFGWIHLGTSTKVATPRARVDVAALTVVIDGSGRRPYRAS
jgi:nitroreductase